MVSPTTEYCKSLIESMLGTPSTTTSTGKSVASLLLSDRQGTNFMPLDTIAIHIINLAMGHPAKIDDLLRFYASLTSSLPADFHEGSYVGREVAIRAIGLQFHDILQSLNPVLEPIAIDLTDDTCQDVHKDADPVQLADSIRQMAANRRTYIVAAAMYARSQTFDALKEVGADMGIDRIEDALNLSDGIVMQTEANYVAAAMYILAAGSALISNLSQEEGQKTTEKLVGALKERVKSERTFHLKVLWSHALAELISGEEGWASEKLFGDLSPLWIM